MEGGPFSKCGSRLSAAHIRLIHFQQLQGCRAARFENVALALAPRTFGVKACNSYMGGERFLFKTGLSLEIPSPFMILELENCNSFTGGGQFAFKL